MPVFPVRVGGESGLQESAGRLAARQGGVARAIGRDDAEADQGVAVLVTELEQGARDVLGIKGDLHDVVVDLAADAGRGQIAGALETLLPLRGWDRGAGRGPL